MSISRLRRAYRYSRLLRYVVEETLDGRSARLKESTVGIDVFGRDPAYDTNVDPVCAQRQPNSGNQWIMRLDANLRYRYVRDREADISYIQDQKDPSRRDWGVHFRRPYSTFLQDYGVITRVLDPSTEKMVIIASGIASYGTMAAGDFLTQEKYMKIVADRAPKGWEHKNMQVVFSTEVISGNAGPSHILATWFW